MLVPALISIGNTRYAARVLNLSTTGAQLGSTVQLDVGALVTFTCGTINAAATIVWQGGGVLGLTFPVEIDQADVRRQVDRTAAIEVRQSQHGV